MMDEIRSNDVMVERAAWVRNSLVPTAHERPQVGDNRLPIAHT